MCVATAKQFGESKWGNEPKVSPPHHRSREFGNVSLFLLQDDDGMSQISVVLAFVDGDAPRCLPP